MTQDEIISMAREVWGERAVLPFNDLERFSALVAAHEREVCAKLCETAMIPNPTTLMFDAGVNSTAGMCAAAIRARGEK